MVWPTNPWLHGVRPVCHVTWTLRRARDIPRAPANQARRLLERFYHFKAGATVTVGASPTNERKDEHLQMMLA
jgi:hypothetical protein